MEDMLCLHCQQGMELDVEFETVDKQGNEFEGNAGRAVEAEGAAGRSTRAAAGIGSRWDGSERVTSASAGTRVVHDTIDVGVGIDAAHAVSSVCIPFAEVPHIWLNCRPSSGVLQEFSLNPVLTIL